MKIMFKKNNNKRKLNTNKHKDMRIPYRIFKTYKKLFLTVITFWKNRIMFRVLKNRLLTVYTGLENQWLKSSR